MKLKNCKSILLLSSLVASGIALSACGGGTSSPPSPPRTLSLSTTNDSVTKKLYANESYILTTTLSDTATELTTVSFSTAESITSLNGKNCGVSSFNNSCNIVYTTSGVGAASVTATNSNYNSATISLQIESGDLLVTSVDNANSGTATDITVSLAAPTKILVPTTVTITNNQPTVIRSPLTCTIPLGSSSCKTQFTGTATVNQPVIFTATTPNFKPATKTVTIKPAELGTFTLVPTTSTIPFGGTTGLTATIPAAATQATTVNFTTTAGTLLANTCSIPVGSTSCYTGLNTTGVSASGATATVTASISGYTNQTTTVTISPAD